MGAGRLLFRPVPWLQTRLQINPRVLKSKPKIGCPYYSILICTWRTAALRGNQHSFPCCALRKLLSGRARRLQVEAQQGIKRNEPPNPMVSCAGKPCVSMEYDK